MATVSPTSSPFRDHRRIPTISSDHLPNTLEGIICQANFSVTLELTTAVLITQSVSLEQRELIQYFHFPQRTRRVDGNVKDGKEPTAVILDTSVKLFQTFKQKTCQVFRLTVSCRISMVCAIRCDRMVLSIHAHRVQDQRRRRIFCLEVGFPDASKVQEQTLPCLL